MLFPFPGLREDVGHGSANLRDDLLNVKRAFAALGRMREPPDGFHMFTEKPFTDAIERFQEDRALSVDGFMNPGGETERNLKRDLGLGPPDVPMDLAELNLSGPVGNALANEPRDLRAVSKALGELGRFNFDRTSEPPPTITKQLDDAIQGFQRSNGLLSDGNVNPGGETVRTLAAAVAEKQGVAQRQASPPAAAAGAVANSGTQQGAPAVRNAGPPTNEVIDLDDYYRRPGFDPDGPGEVSEALTSPVGALKAKNLFFEARRRALELFEADVLSREERNAYQHAWWSYQVTRSADADLAKKFGDAHERTRVDEDNGERLKDLYNNNVGRELALDPANRNRNAETVIIEAISNGKMQTNPFRVFQPPAVLPVRPRPSRGSFGGSTPSR